jgi:hypothetical protein
MKSILILFVGALLLEGRGKGFSLGDNYNILFSTF